MGSDKGVDQSGIGRSEQLVDEAGVPDETSREPVSSTQETGFLMMGDLRDEITFQQIARSDADEGNYTPSLPAYVYGLSRERLQELWNNGDVFPPDMREFIEGSWKQQAEAILSEYYRRPVLLDTKEPHQLAFLLRQLELVARERIKLKQANAKTEPNLQAIAQLAFGEDETVPNLGAVQLESPPSVQAVSEPGFEHMGPTNPLAPAVNQWFKHYGPTTPLPTVRP